MDLISLISVVISVLSFGVAAFALSAGREANRLRTSRKLLEWRAEKIIYAIEQVANLKGTFDVHPTNKRSDFEVRFIEVEQTLRTIEAVTGEVPQSLFSVRDFSEETKFFDEIEELLSNLTHELRDMLETYEEPTEQVILRYFLVCFSFFFASIGFIVLSFSITDFDLIGYKFVTPGLMMILVAGTTFNISRNLQNIKPNRFWKVVNEDSK